VERGVTGERGFDFHRIGEAAGEDAEHDDDQQHDDERDAGAALASADFHRKVFPPVFFPPVPPGKPGVPGAPGTPGAPGSRAGPPPCTSGCTATDGSATRVVTRL